MSIKVNKSLCLINFNDARVEKGNIINVLIRWYKHTDSAALFNILAASTCI